MRIVVSGASGFLGTKLVDRLVADGHSVTRLVRRAARNPAEVRWDPAGGRLDPEALAGAGAVVNLSGAGVGDHRWTRTYQRTLRASRVGPTSTLAATIAGLPAAERPTVLLNASGVGFYGDTGDTATDEHDPAGDSFLADVCRDWEAATGPAEAAGVRVVRMRSGFVLHRDGEFLRRQLLPFRLGIGGKLGNGRQFIPWVSLADWLGAATLLLARGDLAGPVNLVGPNPVRNAEFTREFGALLHRPTIMPIPAFGLRIVLGGFSTEVLNSARILPGVLNEAGYRFRHADVRSALVAAFDDD